MKFKSVLCVTAGLLAAQAHATSTDWGAHNPFQVAASVTPVGSFEDTYLFSLAIDHALFSTAVSNNLTNVLGLANGNVALFREAGAVDLAIGSFAFNETTGSISHAFGTLGSGDYYYQVSGVGTGSAGGFYTLSSAVSAVPEPGAYALLVAGLGVMGFMARRRQS